MFRPQPYFPELAPSRPPPPPVEPPRPAVQEDSPGASPSRRRATEDHGPKNLHACDRCRTKKTKCVPKESGRGQCVACHANSLDCTFDMPLTASRTKRVRRGLHLTGFPRDEGYGGYRRLERQRSGTRDSRSPEPRLSSLRDEEHRMFRLKPAKDHTIRREGSTSLIYILHSAPTIPLSSLDDYDREHQIRLRQLPGNTGDGYIEITHPKPTQSPPDLAAPVLEAMQADSWNGMIERLVATYSEKVSPLLPIVVKDEVDGSPEILRYAMAAAASVKKGIPREIFDALNSIVNREFEEQDTMSDATRHNVQALLVASLVDELALHHAASPQRVARIRLAAALQMAQDLAMDDPLASAQDRRIWHCAVVIDQWNAARWGTRAILSPETFDKIPSSSKRDFLSELLSLTRLLSRVMTVIYGPEGISKATNPELDSIEADFRSWRENLPQGLRLSGFTSPIPAGLIHLLSTSVFILIFRPFMRWSFVVPTKINLNLDLKVWAEIHVASRAALGWASTLDDVTDLLLFGPYSIGLSAFMQYHSWARRRDSNGVVTLDKVRAEGIKVWLARWPDDHLPIQRAQLDLVNVLYSITQQSVIPRSSFDAAPRGLNPTPGSLNRLPEQSINGITFLRDPTHPRGGVLVATQQAAREIKDLPPDTVIIGGPPVDGDDSDQLNPLNSLAALADSASASQTTQIISTGQLALVDAAAGVNPNEPSPMDWDAMVAAFAYPGFDGIAPP